MILTCKSGAMKCTYRGWSIQTFQGWTGVGVNFASPDGDGYSQNHLTGQDEAGMVRYAKCVIERIIAAEAAR